MGTEFSMWAILASSMIVTTPIVNCSKTDQIAGKFTPGKCVPSLTSLQKEILFNQEVIAISQDTTPAGRLLSSDKLKADASECKLTSKLSEADCKLGDGFGCYDGNHSMWTAKGCRGVFECDGVANVQCNHMGGSFTVCPCAAPKPTAALVYGRNLTGGDIAVALYNPSDVAGPGSFDFSLLGWSDGTAATVRDLWAKKDLGKTTGRFPTSGTIEVEPHATVVLRLTRVKSEIVV